MEKCVHLADNPVVHELESLVDVAGRPAVRVDVEGFDQVAELGRCLKASHLNTVTNLTINVPLILKVRDIMVF
jgi:hypothetical protein